MDFTFRIHDYKVGPKVIISDVWGGANRRELLFIMGSSGAGKSSVLDVITGRLVSPGATMRARVQLDGAPLSRKRGEVASVPQCDVLAGALTPREALTLTAELVRRPAAGGAAAPGATRAVVDELLAAFDLVSCADTVVGDDILVRGLSGGEKRRLSVCRELVGRPAVLLLDEPTSGLDSTVALKVVQLLKAHAKKAATVIALVVHQPSTAIYEALDRLLLLAKGGRTAYFGTGGGEILQRFAALGFQCPQYTNPIEYFVEIVADADKADILVDAGLRDGPGGGGGGGAPTGDGPAFSHAGFLRATVLLTKRGLLALVRDPSVVGVRFVMYACLSVLIGSLYYDVGKAQDNIIDVISLLFFVFAFMVFMSIAVMPAMIADRQLYGVESRNGHYGAGAYAAASLLVSLPLAASLASVSTVIIHPMVGLEGSPALFGVALTLALACAESFMFAVAAVVPHYVVGMAAGAGAYGFMMLVQGFFVVPANMPVYWKWARYIAMQYWSFTAVMRDESHARVQRDPRFRGAGKFKCDEARESVFPGNACDGDAVLRFYEMRSTSTSDCLVVLIMMTVGYRALGAFALWRSNERAVTANHNMAAVSGDDGNAGDVETPKTRVDDKNLF